MDHSGNLVISDFLHQRIRVVAARTGTFYGQPMTARDIYTVAGNGIQGFSGDGGPATNAELNFPEGVAVDAAGNLLIADRGQPPDPDGGGPHRHLLRAADDRRGHLYRGRRRHSRGSPATAARPPAPRSTSWQSVAGVAVDAAGNLLIADFDNNRVRVVAATHRHLLRAADDRRATSTPWPATAPSGFSGDGGPATSAELSLPEGVAVDAAGNLLIADSDNNRVRVVAASTGTFYGQPMTAGDIYTVAGNGTSGFSGDGGPATSAGLSPQGVAVDAAGNLLIADTGNSRVRVVAAQDRHLLRAGDDRRGHLHRGRQRHQGFSGDGGPATSAELSGPAGVAVDAAGNLLIADTENNRVRVVAAHDRHLLRAGDDRRGHLHRGRRRHQRVLRRRRPGHQRRTQRPGRAWRWTPPGTC